jgi:PPOX class probable F420-dependent enzyme
VEIDAAVEFVRANGHAVLATLASDGSPQLSPILAGVLPGTSGEVCISTRETAYKVRNLRRDPRAWLCVLPDGFFGSWIQVAATVTIDSLPAAMESLVEYYRTTAGEHDDWDEYRAAMTRDQRCLLRLQLTKAGPDRSG